jgi:hypothetical protein
MPDLSAPDDPYGLLGGNWPPESESAYSTASETVAQNSGGYSSAAEEVRRRATAVQEEWSTPNLAVSSTRLDGTATTALVASCGGTRRHHHYPGDP